MSKTTPAIDHGQPKLRAVTRLVSFVVACLGAVLPANSNALAQDAPPKPNIVIVFADDLGYGDVGCFGATGYETPHLDRMAAEGRKFTSFYVAQAVCGASRAALLTGCYANRIGMLGAPSHATKHGINDNEMLLSELVKQQGYATAIYGKWHLGSRPQFLPRRHGFDEYFGLPYSNDMWPFHPENPNGYPDLPLIEGDDVAIPSVTHEDQTHLTSWYTEHALKFIDKHHDGPFLLYVAHSMPHVPLHVSDKFAGKTGRGLFGDVIEEVDWSVGQILGALQRHGIDDRTLVIFTSDNGPWLSYGNHAGSAGPLREGKGTTWEGGVREPCIMRWPGKIPAGTVCDELAATIDIFPTVAALTGARLPDHPIDGEDIYPLMSDAPGAKTPHEAYYYYWGNHLQAIRSGDWKLHFPHEYRSLTGTPGRDGKPGGYSTQKTELALYNLKTDVGETTDVKGEHPEVVARLQRLAEAAREELGDSAQQRQGKGFRPPARIDG
jgi:arylsulfatase A-like enzyme